MNQDTKRLIIAMAIIGALIFVSSACGIVVGLILEQHLIEVCK